MNFDRYTLELLLGELSAELQGDILPFWQHMSDLVNGGFHGRVDADNKVHKDADRGAVMYSGIMRAFSAAYNIFGDNNYLVAARSARDYLLARFMDYEHGGVFWTVDHLGTPADRHKHICAQSAAIGGLCEYYKATADEQALAAAVRLTERVDMHARDARYGGYCEAYERDWKPSPENGPGGIIAPGPKGLVTQMQVLDAYTHLYIVKPTSLLENRIRELIELFRTRIFDPVRGRLGLFFSQDWAPADRGAGPGSLIMASWMLDRAAEAVGIRRDVWPMAEQFATLSREGLRHDGSITTLGEPMRGHHGFDWQWWLYAQSMIGYFNMYRRTGANHWLHDCLHLWKFINDRLIDRKGGEWFAGIDTAGNLSDADKAGIWKSPAPNSRMCTEVILMITGHLK